MAHWSLADNDTCGDIEGPGLRATRPVVSDRMEDANTWLSRPSPSPAHLLATFTMPPPTVFQPVPESVCVAGTGGAVLL